MPTAVATHSSSVWGNSGGRKRPSAQSLFGSSSSDDDSEPGIELTALTRDLNAVQVATEVLKARVDNLHNRLNNLNDSLSAQNQRLNTLENDNNVYHVHVHIHHDHTI